MDAEPVLIGYVKLELEIPNSNPNESLRYGGPLDVPDDGLENDLVNAKVENAEEAETTSSSPEFILPEDWDGVTPEEMDSTSGHEGGETFADPKIEVGQVDVKLFESNSVSLETSCYSKSNSTLGDDLAKMWKLRPCYVKLYKLMGNEAEAYKEEAEAARLKALIAERNKVVRHSSPSATVCKFCGRSFKTHHEKRKHMCKYHYIGVFSCPVKNCTYTSYTKYNWERHKKRSNCPILKDPPPVPSKDCEYCGVEMSSVKSVRRHLRNRSCPVRELQLRREAEMETVKS